MSKPDYKNMQWSNKRPTKPGKYWFMKQGGPLEPQLIPVPEIFEWLTEEDTVGLYAGPVDAPQEAR